MFNSEIWEFIIFPLLMGLLGGGSCYLFTRTKRAVCEHQWFNMVVVSDRTHKDTGQRARLCEKCWKMEQWNVADKQDLPTRDTGEK